MYVFGRLPSLGRQNIRLYVLVVCPEKDLAILRRDDPGNSHIELSTELAETDEVMAIGYPLGREEIKFLVGRVSGFSPCENEISPSFVQITAPVNEGSSGGPLINSSGQVVGMVSAGIPNAQNVGFAIGAKVILSVYQHLLGLVPERANAYIQRGEGPVIYRAAKFSCEWMETNDALLEHLAVKSEGVLITKVHSDSVAHMLQPGDILCAIHSSLGVGIVDRHGDVYCEETTHKDQHTDITQASAGKKSRTLLELFDLLPQGEVFEIHFWRSGQLYSSQVEFSPKATSLFSRFLHWEPVDSAVCCGIHFAPLTFDYAMRNMRGYTYGRKKYDNVCVIIAILPGSEASLVNLMPGDILVRVNGQPIASLDDLSACLAHAEQTNQKCDLTPPPSTQADVLVFEFKEGKIFAARLDTESDERAARALGHVAKVLSSR